jgi:hypothetical protein
MDDDNNNNDDDVEQMVKRVAGEAIVLRETLLQFRFVHHKSHMT